MPTLTELTTLMAQDRFAVARKLDATYPNGRVKRINVWSTILEIEIQTGSSFLVSMPEGVPYLSVGLTRDTIPIPRSGKGGDRFWAYLDRRYGISESEGQDGIARHLLGKIRNYAMQHGSRVELRRFSAYKTKEKEETIYLSSYNGSMWRLDGENIMSIANGEDDVFFVDDDGGKYVEPEVGANGVLFDKLIAPISFAESGMGGISAEQMRMAYIVWIFSLALPDLMPTKPLLILEGAPGSGKCLGLGTPVLMFDGTVRAVEDVREGDLLMGPDSKPKRVLATTRGRDQMFRITPVKGDAWTCNSRHVLTLVSSHTDRVFDIPVQEFLQQTPYIRLDRKQFMMTVDFPKHLTSQPIDPYFLGVWYGDGRKDLTSVQVTKPDPEIEALMHETAKQWDLDVRMNRNSSGCPTYSITAGNGGQFGKNQLLWALRDTVGSGTTFPHRYLTGSKAERAAFLAGLLDSDGYYQSGYYEIVQKRRGFADGICFVARSLGLRAVLTEKRIAGYDYPFWRVTISGDLDFLPLRIPRKKASPRRQVKDAARTAISIDAIGVGDYAGFTLDGDGRFLLGDFTVTHNSAALQLLQHALLGKAKPIILSRNKEDDFGVLLLRSPICVFDNLDAYIDWIPDAICAYTTAGEWTKRKFFTDAEELTLKPHAFIAVASKNPASFRREDVADRCVILRLDRRERFTRFQALEAEIKQLRPQILGEYLYYVNKIIAEVRAGTLQLREDEGHRMADFAALARVVGRVLAWEEGAVADLLVAIQGEQGAFINEEDPLVDLLHKWIVYNPRNGAKNAGRDVSLFTLYQELETISQGQGMTFYKGPRMLAQKLRSPHIERDFIVQMMAPDGHKSYRIWRKSDPRLESVPMPKSEPDEDNEPILIKPAANDDD